MDWLPTTPLVPDRVQPALVDVDQAAFGKEKLEELYRALLTLDQTPNRVGFGR